MTQSRDSSLQGRSVGRGNPGPDLPALGSKFAWMNEAACNGQDPEMWFTPEDVDMTKEAIKLCRGCDVQLNCMRFAIENNEEFGLWGGSEASVLIQPLRGRRALRRLEARKEEWTP